MCTQTSLPVGYRLSIVDVGLVIESLIGGAYCSTYTRKPFRAAYGWLQGSPRPPQTSPRAPPAGAGSSRPSSQRGLREAGGRASPPASRLEAGGGSRSRHQLHFFRTAQPSKPKVAVPARRDAVGGATSTNRLPRPPQGRAPPPGSSREGEPSAGPSPAPPQLSFNFNDLFVWAVLQQRQQMALFLWQHGEEALARAAVACKLYRSMALEARRSSMDDSSVERLRTFSQ